MSCIAGYGASTSPLNALKFHEYNRLKSYILAQQKAEKERMRALEGRLLHNTHGREEEEEVVVVVAGVGKRRCGSIVEVWRKVWRKRTSSSSSSSLVAVA
ncbi:MAG: hypothetical protein M1834_005690 [Cirrosporium novae-zelandiae]|nr:MAG: hypothetical protein M1834_005690 [Cirrosporium novae-zelandiae]